MLGNGLPFLLGPLLVGDVHLFTLLFWLFVRIVETCDGHRCVWALRLLSPAEPVARTEDENLAGAAGGTR